IPTVFTEPIRPIEELDRVHRRHAGAVGDLPAAGLAVAGGKVGSCGGDVVEEAFANRHRDLVLLLLESVGPGDAAAVDVELDHVEIGDERKKIERRLADTV